MPCLHLKGYQPDSFSYGFRKVSTVFRHSFRFLFWKMSQNDNIASSGHMSFDRYCFSLSYCERHLQLIYYRLYILKTTWGLIIKNIWHVFWTLQVLFGIFVTAQACGFLNITCQPNGGILDINIILWNKMNIYCVIGSLVSANIQRSSKVSDSF